MTWDRKYKRGTKVSERTFHDDLHTHLLADPELGGRVERGSPLRWFDRDDLRERCESELAFVRLPKEEQDARTAEVLDRMSELMSRGMISESR